MTTHIQINKILLIGYAVHICSRQLEIMGYRVVTAHDVDDGINQLVTESPDIVITPLNLNHLSAVETIKRIKELTPDTEVILIADQKDINSAIELLRYGVSDVISGPVNRDILDIFIERAKEKVVSKRNLNDYITNLDKICRIDEKDVKRKSDFLNKLITSSNDGIVATDDEGNIIVFNPCAENIFGFSSFEVIKKTHYSKLYPREIAEEFNRAFEQRKDISNSEWSETVIRDKNRNDVPVRFSGALLFENGVVIGSVCFFRDLREIKKLQQELVKSERLAAIGQTVFRLAHYIKNILMGLKGGTYVVNVGLDKGDSDKLRSGWSMVQRNVDRVSSLVSNLLSYSKDRTPEYKKCDPNKVTEDVCALIAAKATENQIEIVKDFDPSIDLVSMDPDIVHRALLNLVSNAIDACIFDLDISKHFRVLVRTKITDDNMIFFEIEDNGCGMTDEVRKKLFTAFFSTKGAKGTGLGLLITQKNVQEHGGTIRVASKLGQGSTFTIGLPFNKVTV